MWERCGAFINPEQTLPLLLQPPAAAAPLLFSPARVPTRTQIRSAATLPISARLPKKRSSKPLQTAHPSPRVPLLSLSLPLPSAVLRAMIDPAGLFIRERCCERCEKHSEARPLPSLSVFSGRISRQSVLASSIRQIAQRLGRAQGCCPAIFPSRPVRSERSFHY